MRGTFIVLEGIDGCGKTTIAKLLAAKLRKAGEKVIVTGEPTNGPIGKKIHDILQGKLPAPAPIDFQKLYIADRLYHTERIIKPVLMSGSTVICQRYALSTFAYGTAFGVSRGALRHNFMKPDMTFFLDLSAEDAMRRIKRRGDGTEYFEKQNRLEKVSVAYRKLARGRSFGPITTLDAMLSPRMLISQIDTILAHSG